MKITNEEAIKELKAMLNALDPRFLTWDRERMKVGIEHGYCFNRKGG